MFFKVDITGEDSTMEPMHYYQLMELLPNARYNISREKVQEYAKADFSQILNSKIAYHFYKLGYSDAFKARTNSSKMLCQVKPAQQPSQRPLSTQPIEVCSNELPTSRLSNHRLFGRVL
ncbi:hypothetical protein QTP88_007218 [Uroleucon formosanum]